MAIAKIERLRLIGLKDEKDKILDALRNSGAVEIKECGELTGAQSFPMQIEADDASVKNDYLKKQLEYLVKHIERYCSDNKIKRPEQEKSTELTFEQFSSVVEREKGLTRVLTDVDEISQKLSANQGITNRLKLNNNNLAPYLECGMPFSTYLSTASVRIELGILPTEKVFALKAIADESGLTEFTEYGTAQNGTAVLVVSHKSESEAIFQKLYECGFQKCPFTDGFTAREKTDENLREIKAYEKENAQLEEKLYSLRGSVGQLMVLSDYYDYCAEKKSVNAFMKNTEKTFVLEAFAVQDEEKTIKDALNAVSAAIYIEFTPLAEGETPPTLMKNNSVVGNFEFVTNMYSPPNYNEFDPNPIMSIFFVLFMGFIMADVGYGLLMCLIGFGITISAKRKTGMTSLFNVIAYGGLSSILFGFLFGSVFGFTNANFAFIPKSVMPDPQNAIWSLSGIKIQSVLLICFGAGIVQIAVGQLCNAYQQTRRGRFWDGFFDGIMWALFLVGLMIFAVSMIEELPFANLKTIGLSITLGALIIEIFAAGRHEKGFGKAVKGFGAVYGIINYLSDILSYARLYGLMLSGAIVAAIVDDLAIGIMAGGGITYIFGALVLLVGHGFNFGMGLLSAYIHDARLQYMEFYSRFYEGEGELFKPFGYNQQYVRLVKRRNEELRQAKNH